MKVKFFIYFIFLPFASMATEFEILDASSIFFSNLKKADSIGIYYSHIPNIRDYSAESTDSVFSDILKKTPQIYGITKINKNGDIEFDINRSSTISSNQNVKNKNWFRIPLLNAKPHIGGIVNANSKACFLKSYPVMDTSLSQNPDGVIAILIDIDYCLKSFCEKYDHPFSLIYNNSILYQNEPELLFSRIRNPEYPSLEFLYANNLQPVADSLIPSPYNQKSSTNMLQTVFLCISAIICIIILSILFLNKHRVKKEDFIAMQYNKLSEETKKLVQERAMSQLYCEIKRQIEIHESDKIENEVREKLYKEIIKKNIKQKNMSMP